MILCIQNKPGTFTRQDPRPPLRFPFSIFVVTTSDCFAHAHVRRYRYVYYTYVNVTNFRCTYHMRMRIHKQFRLGCRLPCLWLEKMSETSVKIIKNEVRCRDDTVPKTVDTRKHCKVGMQQSSATPSLHLCFSGLRKIVACSQPYLAVLSCIYSFCHGVIPTSYFIFTLVYIASTQYTVILPYCSLSTHAKSIAADILTFLSNICGNLLEREYVKANDIYLQMAIGNAPWTIGVTMVGIHARTGREKIFAQQIAHVLNDETQRKYIQVKMTVLILFVVFLLSYSVFSCI